MLEKENNHSAEALLTQDSENVYSKTVKKRDLCQGCQNSSARRKRKKNNLSCINKQFFIQRPKIWLPYFHWQWQRRAFFLLIISSPLSLSHAFLSPPAVSLLSTDMKESSLPLWLRSLSQMKRKQFGCYSTGWQGNIHHPAIMICLGTAGHGLSHPAERPRAQFESIVICMNW